MAHVALAGCRAGGDGRGGFGLLLGVGMLDGVAGMIVLLFLPTVLEARGASLPEVGFALWLLFVGGACGKAACGWLGTQLGLLTTVAATEIGTARGILLILWLPLLPAGSTGALSTRRLRT